MEIIVRFGSGKVCVNNKRADGAFYFADVDFFFRGAHL